MVFVITGLKETVPSVVKACPEVTVNGEWLSQEILKCIFQLINSGFFLLGLLLQTVIQPMWMPLTFYLINLRETKRI